jgi:hypothetical protein
MRPNIDPSRRPVALLAGALVLALAAACSSGGGTRKVSSPEGTAVVDEATGVIVLPLDRYSLSHSERLTVEYGRLLLVRACMRGKGLDYLAVDRRGEKEPVSRRYGIWVMPEAVRYGYAPPPPSETEKLITRDNKSQKPAWHEAAIACGQELGSRVAVPDPLPGDMISLKGYPQLMSSVEAQAIVEEWRVCLRAARIKPPPPEEIYPPEGLDAPLHTQIKIAVADVRCKQQTRFVSRMATLEAHVQSAVIGENEVRLNDQRHMLEKVIKDAEAVIATTPA